MAERDLDIAWAAGLFEGEGCATYFGGSSRRPRVALSMTDEDTVRRFARIMGRGSVYRREGRTAHHKPRWDWTVQSGSDVLHCLGLIWGYLGERRRERATEVIERAAKIGEPSTGGGRRSTGLCKHGHDLNNPQHLYLHAKTGKRHCRTCRAVYARGWYQRRKET